MNPRRIGLALVAFLALAGISRGTLTAQITPAAIISVVAGWNLIAAPEGTIVGGAVGSLYTLQAGDAEYEVLPNGAPLHAGHGYWAYFSRATSFPVPSARRAGIGPALPAGQYVMVGNPSSVPVVIQGADSVYVYQPSKGWVATTLLAPGQGALAASGRDGVAVIAPADVAAAPSPNPRAP